jgi:signal transduction histidine kinase
MSKKRPARHERSRSLAISGWPLRFKVALAIAIPLLLAATLGGLQVRSDLNEAANSSTSAKQVTVLRPAVAYLTAAERAMVAAQDPSEASAADLESAVQDVQDAAQQLTQVSDTADLTTEQRYQVDALLDLSRAIRDANTQTLSPETWIAQLRQLQSGVTQLIATIANAQLDPEPQLELLDQALGGRFSLAMQQALAATERSGKTGSLELFQELGVEAAAIDRLASALGETEPAIATLRTDNAQRTRTVRTIRTGTDELGGPGAYTEYDALTEKLTDGIDQQLDQSASDARRSALISGAITLGALLATILLAFLVSRLLLNPIRKVREGARTVAHEQLPEAVARIRAGDDPGPITPIDVATHEEVGQLARAVDELHRQAVTLAAGEARLRSQVSEMFITLSRRNTSLINQQLGLIETLEKDEEDPQRLESLFRLDHLAARMRRTADSLLVLADAPTHTSAQDDLTVASALQAATAGVQDYRRVRVGSASTARIGDAAAADVVHLLTELVDNALAYSAPTTTVLLSSNSGPDGVTVEIEDAGLGIPDQALADINQTLRTGADVTPDTARRMGLFVVSRLAQRHGITVSLRGNGNNGTTATVVLPTSMLQVSAPEVPAASPARPVQPAAPLPQRTATPAKADVPTPTPAKADVSTPAKAEVPSLEERLNAAMGLPRRQPGAQAPQTTPMPPAAAAPADVPSQQASVDPAPEEPPGPPPTAAAYAAASHAPPPTVTSAGDRDAGPAFPPLADSEAEADTPIFKALRSAWLSAHATDEAWRSSEIEAGWARADRVAASLSEAPVNASGLPVRRPGTRLVPGGVAKPASVGARDPDAIRARLAAHAAGVSRGRAAAATTPDKQPSKESPA